MRPQGFSITQAGLIGGVMVVGGIVGAIDKTPDSAYTISALSFRSSPHGDICYPALKHSLSAM